MDPVTTSIFTVLTVILFAYGVKKEIERSRRLKRSVEYFEKVDVNSQMSKIATKELEVSEHEGLILFKMSCRMMTVVSNKHVAFTIRANVGKEILGFRFYILHGDFTINVVDTGKKEKVYGVNMFSNQNESDSFLKMLLDVWLIEKRGKPRMKQDIAGYAYLNEGDINRLKSERIEFVWNMGVKSKSQLEPRLGIAIDWQKGVFEIYELDIVLRELLINRMMV